MLRIVFAATLLIAVAYYAISQNQRTQEIQKTSRDIEPNPGTIITNGNSLTPTEFDSESYSDAKRGIPVQSSWGTIFPFQKEPEDLQEMKKGKWIVTFVKRDGAITPAQFGQKIGDVITFKTNPFRDIPDAVG